MKLIVCRECGEMLPLSYKVKSCRCGKSQGVYLTVKKAIYSGPCLPLGADNRAIAELILEGRGTLQIFTIADTSPNFRRVDEGVAS